MSDDGPATAAVPGDRAVRLVRLGSPRRRAPKPGSPGSRSASSRCTSSTTTGCSRIPARRPATTCQRPRTAHVPRSSSRRLYPRLRAGARAAVALLVGAFGILFGIPAASTTCRTAAPRATTTPACSRSPRAAPAPRRARDALASRRRDEPAVAPVPAAALLAARRRRRAPLFIVFPDRLLVLSRTRGRTCAAPNLGAPYEDVSSRRATGCCSTAGTSRRRTAPP